VLYDIKEKDVDQLWSFDASSPPLTGLTSTTNPFPRAVKFQGNVHFGHFDVATNSIIHVIYDESKKQHKTSTVAIIRK
jgi:hypothetical protein